MPFNDVDFRQRVSLCNARSQVSYVCHEANRTPQSGGCGFKDVVSPLSDEDDHATAVGDKACSSALDNDAPFAHIVCCALSLVWGTPILRPHQVAAYQKIIFDRRCGGKLLLVVRTGAGKTHVAGLTATMVGGIAVILVPLLPLTLDILEGLRRSSDLHGSVEAHYIDDLSAAAVRGTLVLRIN